MAIIEVSKQITNYLDSEEMVTAPANPVEGQRWTDTSKSPPVAMIYKNGEWKAERLSVEVLDPDFYKDLEDTKTEVAVAVEKAEAAEQAGKDAQAAGESAKKAAEDAKQVGEAAKVAGAEAKAAAENAGLAAADAKAVGVAAQQEAEKAKQAGDNAANLATQADAAAKAAKAKADAIEINVSGVVSDVASINVTATDAYNKAVSAGGAINELETTVDGQKQTIATAQSTASSALNKATVVETSVDGLKQTVASTTIAANSALTKATNVETTVNGLQLTVSNVEVTANNANAKALQVEATANGLTTKVTAVETSLANSGNPNLLPYGGGNPTTINGWTAAAGLALSTHVFYKTGMSNLYVLTNPNTAERTVSSARFTVKPDTQYTFKFTGFAASNVSDMDVWWLSRAKGSTANYDRTKMLVSARRLSPSKAEEVSVTFTTNAADSEGYIRFDNNGSNNGSNAQLFFIDVMMVEGPVAPKEWSPAYVELATSSQITQLSDQMNFKLTSSDGGVTQIDMQNKIVTIASENIYLTGKSYISDAIIKTAHIVDLAVSNGKIANLAVTEGKIANLAVTNAKIANLSVTEGKIGDAAITNAKIGNLAVSEAKIASLAVSEGKIANLAVTEGKIGNLAVTTAKIADLAVNNAKIASLDAAKINTGYLAAARIAATSITADKLNVEKLSALTSKLGEIDAGTINGVTINGSTFVNAFSYTEGGITYTGTTTIFNGNVQIARTGSDGSSWSTTLDRSGGFIDTYQAAASAPSRTTQLGQGQLYMVESGVGGYLPAAALNSSSWVNLPYASGFTTAESNPCQYRVFNQIDGSKLIRFRGQFQPTSGTLTTAGTYPFGQGTLPAAIRPSKTEFAYAAVNNGNGGRLAVTSAGSFILHAAQSGNSYCSISGMSYLID